VACAKTEAPPIQTLDIIETKITVPSTRRSVVARRALLDRLASVPADVRMITVTGPAGYGKSTLLAAWAEHDPRPTAWVSVDRRDNDPVILLSHVAGALDSSEPVGRRVVQVLQAPDMSLWGKIVPRLGSYLAARRIPVALVLDDVHELETPDCRDALTALADHLGDGSVLVLSGRHLALSLVRLRSAGRLVEIGEADLRLSDQEAEEIVSNEGVTLDSEAIVELNRHTEGWAAGLYMAAIGSRADPKPLSGGQFKGDDRLVVDYLRSELLSSLPDSDVEFLTRTSVVERMCGDLCDAMLERSDSAARLQAIERSNLFLVPLDRMREWYRYHHLFREMLSAELQVREPHRIPALRLRAVEWYAANGLPMEAVEQALSSGADDRAAELMAECALTVYRTGRVVTLERWLAAFADERQLKRFPVVGAFGVWVHALRGRDRDAARWLAAIESAPSNGPLPDGSPSLDSWLAILRALLCQQGAAEMLADATRASRELAPTSFWRPQMLVLLGLATMITGDRDAADPILAEAVELGSSLGAFNVSLTGLAERALIALDRGEPTRAKELIEEGIRIVEEGALDENGPAGILQAAAARVFIQQGDTPSALEAIARADRLRSVLTRAIPTLAVQTRLELAHAQLALANPGIARQLHDEARQILSRTGDLGLLSLQADELHEQIKNADTTRGRWASGLTTAELRLLPLLSTHLTFAEIGERLFITRNTVKTHAISIYRKLGVSSRNEAVEVAAELGLLDAAVIVRSQHLIP
jgi:LuxR family maltose regulon positive regulatory protein